MGDITDEELHDVVEDVMLEEIQTLRVSVEDWKKVAQDWAKENLATTMRAIEAEAALAAARAELERARGASDRMVDAFSSTLDRIASAMGCDPDPEADLVEAVRLLVHERDEARAEVEGLRAARAWRGKGAP